MRLYLLSLLLLASASIPAFAWGSRGHELVAYLAYIHATSATQARIDQLVALNPCYTQWQATVAKDTGITADLDKRAALFMLAATWPDMIKGSKYSCPHASTYITTDGGTGNDGKFNSNVPPAGPEASQNIGYDDDRRHQYWHFIDIPYSSDGTTTYPTASVNAVSELELLSKSLKTSADPKLNSYDLMWITHLAGDIHQPLHSADRFSKDLPYGDAGGNFEKICATEDSCGSNELHAYWDNLPGALVDLHEVIAQAKDLDTAQTKPIPGATSFTTWSNQAFKLAKTDAYAAPFDTGGTRVLESAITPQYSSQAKTDMQKQITLAGARLARLLNTDLGKRKNNCCKLPQTTSTGAL